MMTYYFEEKKGNASTEIRTSKLPITRTVVLPTALETLGRISKLARIFDSVIALV